MMVLRRMSVALLSIAVTSIASVRADNIPSKAELVVVQVICPAVNSGTLVVMRSNELGQRDRSSVYYNKRKVTEAAVAAAEKGQDFEEYIRINRYKKVIIGKSDEHDAFSLSFMENVIRQAEAAAKLQCSLR